MKVRTHQSVFEYDLATVEPSLSAAPYLADDLLLLFVKSIFLADKTYVGNKKHASEAKDILAARRALSGFSFSVCDRCSNESDDRTEHKEAALSNSHRQRLHTKRRLEHESIKSKCQ